MEARIAQLRPTADARLAAVLDEGARRDRGLARASGGDRLPAVAWCARHEPRGLRRAGGSGAIPTGSSPRWRPRCPARRVLFPLYAFNIEVSRAPWVTAEPMIAEMRLQFWRDVVEEIAAGKPPRAHEVAAPLAERDPAPG